MVFSDEICQEVAVKKEVSNPNQPHKVDCTPRAVEKPNGNLESKIYFEKLPDGIVENILVFVKITTREACETYRYILMRIGTTLKP